MRLTTRDGGITLENFTKLASYTGVFADSFLLAIIATLVCLHHWLSPSPTG